MPMSALQGGRVRLDAAGKAEGGLVRVGDSRIGRGGGASATGDEAGVAAGVA